MVLYGVSCHGWVGVKGERGFGLTDLDRVAGLPQGDGGAEAADARADDDDLERHVGIDGVFGVRERSVPEVAPSERTLERY